MIKKRNKQFSGKIISFSNEASNIRLVTISLQKKLSFIPGQYVLLAFPNNLNEKRAFSIISGFKNSISLCIKKHGSFTNQLFSSKPNDKILVFGPYGGFILPKEEKKLVFLAGGIGITPLYSMLNHVIKINYQEKILLFYSAKRKTEMAFLDELQKIKSNNIKIEFFFTQEGPKKRISIDVIEKAVPQLKQTLFYLCGPVPMMENIRNKLLSKGVNESQIIQEEFK